MGEKRSTGARAPDAHYVCGRCGLKVYKSQRTAHDAACAAIIDRFGGSRQLAQLFYDEPLLCLDDLAGQLPPGCGVLLRRMVIDGGVSSRELAARRDDREATATHARRRCCRCRILLDGKGVPPGCDDPSRMCGWCDGSTPPVIGHAVARGRDRKEMKTWRM